MKKFALALLLTIGLFSLKATAQTTKVPETTTPFSIADSAAYTGKYKYEGLPFVYMSISVRDGKLYYEGGEYNGSLTPMKENRDMFDANGMATFTFLRNDKNEISELQIDYQGETYLGKKETEEPKKS